MRKSLIIVLALAVVFTLGLGVMAEGMESKCYPPEDDPCEQDVNVQAPFLLECSCESSGTVSMIFNMNAYEDGYVEKMDQMNITVGAPSNWDVGATVNHNNKGVADALLVSGGAGWVDVGTGWNTIKSGGQGVTTFPIHYRVELDDLNSSSDINETVTVTYDFI